MFYYKILFPLAINGGFVYSSDEKLNIGERVIVDFKSKKRIGIVWDETQKPEYDTKGVIERLDEKPILGCEIIETLKFFSFYYLAFEGLMLKAALPSKVFSLFEKIDLSEEMGVVEIEKSPFDLTDEQENVVNSIDIDKFGVHLLFGATGSGKTEVYLRLIERVLKKGKKAVVLVPEIALTPQYVDVFKERFKGKISLIHSRLTPKQKFLNWLCFLRSEARILIGTRSAVFADFDDVGIVVVDEENDESYKQETNPAYNAKDIAIYRAKKMNIPVILSSATPSVESYYRAATGKFKMHRMKRRVGGIALPDVEFVRLEGDSIFADYTLKAIGETIRENRTVAVLVNRRGFAEYMVCRDCGYLFLCTNCSVSLTYHKEDNSLKCHWCESKFDLPRCCPKCGSVNLEVKGIGSQRVVEELKKHFSNATVERFDRDSTSKKGEFERIISRLRDGEIDILVGTQMLSKGHDISKIGLVVVADLESLFVSPDFRATERALALIVQTAGRSGRKERGRVIVQSLAEKTPFEDYIKNHDFESFLKREIPLRKAFLYPPFSRIIRIVAESTKKDKTFKLIGEVEAALKVKGEFNMIGPAKCPVFKLRNRFRYHILIKSFSILKDLGKIKERVNLKNGIHFDVDPVSFF